MQTTKTLRFHLLMAGAIAASIGASILFTPVQFHSANGVLLGDNPSLLSEMRAPGGALFAFGLFMLAGALRATLASPAALLAVGTYLAYGVARLLSLQQDGIPANGLLAATGVEFLVGLSCVWALRREFRLQRDQTAPLSLGELA